jgi:hypothetical protein
MLDQSLFTIRALAVAIVALGSFSLYLAYRRNTLMSGTAGLHASLLIFMGIGPLTYTFTEPIGERVGVDTLLAALVPPFTWLLLGYSIAVVAEFFVYRKSPRRSGIRPAEIDAPTVFMFGGLAILGYTMSLFEFSTSGIGTIFPILGTFLYPVIVITVAAYRPTNLLSTVSTLFSLGLAGYFSIFSLWRSQLIMFLVSIGIGALLRSRKGLWLFPLVAAVILYLILPFQQLKKTFSEEFVQDPEAFFYTTLGMTLEDRNAIIVNFASGRMNGAREMAYVQAGLDNGQIVSRRGEGYVDAIKQLVPRLFWSDKPSYNQTTGFALPRDVGLVSWDDQFTSWGVGFWAEVIWNFPYQCLILLVPLFFLGTAAIDRGVYRVLQQPARIWIAQATLFFLFLQLVSIINFVTYALWLFIIVVAGDYLLRRTQPRSDPIAIMKGRNADLTLR